MPRQQEDALKEQLGATLCNNIIGIRNRRRMVEETWLRSRRAWMNQNIADRSYLGAEGSANYNIPSGRRAAERTVVRGVKMLTPNVKWFEVAPMGDMSDDKLSNVDKFMWYVLRKRIKSRSNISQLVRSMLMYGLCHLKTSIMMRNGQVWPSQRVVDPFAFYIFPETASTADEAEMIFEDFLFSYERYKTFASKGMVEDIASSDLVKPDWPYHLTERLAYQGITDPTQDIDTMVRSTSDKLEKTGAAFVSLTELWLSREDKLYQVYIAWNLAKGARIVGFFQSEYDEPLYRSVIHRALPGELYTNSMMEDITELDALSNDQLNKFQEAVDREQGMIGAAGSARHDSWRFKGGAIWLSGQDDPRQAFNFMQPNMTSTNQLRAWQIYLGMINSMAGTGTIAEGQPGRNMPRAGGAVNNLVNLSLADIQDVSELIEQEVLTPSLGDIYKVASTFIPDHQLMRIPGGSAMYGANTRSNIMKRTDIMGDYEFEWVGSLQFQDDAQRSQRLLIFLNMLPQLEPYLQQQGYTSNMVELVKMIWRYGLGERGLSDVVVPMKQQQGMQGGAMQQGAQGSGMMQNGNGATSSPTSNGSTPGLSYNLPTVTQGFVQR